MYVQLNFAEYVRREDCITIIIDYMTDLKRVLINRQQNNIRPLEKKITERTTLYHQKNKNRY